MPRKFGEEPWKYDVEAQLSAVERNVSSLQRGGHPARAVTLSRSYATSLRDLWDAVTTGERIPRWFLPVSGELQLGGRYQLEGNAGGVVKECEPLRRFALTWEFAGDVSWVEVGLKDDEVGLVSLTLTHTAHLSDHWNTYGPGAAGVGWELGFMGLSLHIEQPEEPKPDVEAFVASPDGRAIIEGSSDRWGLAAIADGMDPEAASAAAMRTTAFYTGEAFESD